MANLNVLLFAAALAAPLPAQNCTKTSTGLVPLTDLGLSKYKSFDGGLYGSGKNTPPAAHAAAGAATAKDLKPLDATGKVDAKNGRIVVISIGMSNTTQEFSTWVRMSNSDPKRDAPVRVVDCAQGGQDARKIADSNARFWTVANQRIAKAGVTPLQVQVAWIKQALARPTNGFPGAAKDLQGFLAKIARILKTKYPNIRLAYVSSRTYAGYATTTLNPEPYAYESGFSVRWLVEQQIRGDATLNFDPKKGKVVAPLLLWGPYLWTDGTKGRKIDKLVWECRDVQKDGTHPSTSGRQKVADLLDAFFKNDMTTQPWYVGSGGGGQAVTIPYGSGCPGSRGKLLVRTSKPPVIGTRINFGTANAKARAPAVLMLAGAKASIALDPSCRLLVDPAQLLFNVVLVTDGQGRAIVPLQIPNDANLAGKSLFGQWLVLDSGAPGLRLLGGAALSHGDELRFGR